MTDQRQPGQQQLRTEPRQPPENPPHIPSAAMYIGLCQTRAQAATLRWQYAVVFMALNGAVGGACLNFLDYHKAGKVIPVALIAILMIYANGLFRGLVNRANQWIDYFTVKIERIEEIVGTESGIFVFADPLYPAKDAASSLVRGLRFRHGIRALSDAMLLLWICAGLSCAIWGAYLAGQGSW